MQFGVYEKFRIILLWMQYEAVCYSHGKKDICQRYEMQFFYILICLIGKGENNPDILHKKPTINSQADN